MSESTMRADQVVAGDVVEFGGEWIEVVATRLVEGQSQPGTVSWTVALPYGANGSLDATLSAAADVPFHVRRQEARG